MFNFKRPLIGALAAATVLSMGIISSTCNAAPREINNYGGIYMDEDGNHYNSGYLNDSSPIVNTPSGRLFRDGTGGFSTDDGDSYSRDATGSYLLDDY